MYDISKHLILLYIISFLSGISCISISSVISNSDNSGLIKKIRDLNIAFFANILVSFADYYRAFFFSKWEMNVFLMFLSNFSLVVLLYYWMRLVQHLLENLRFKIWLKLIKIEGIIYLIAWLIVYLIYMDADYNLYSLTGKLLAIIPDTIFFVALTGLNVYCILAAKDYLIDRQLRYYFLAINAMILIYNCWGYMNDVALVFYPLGSLIYAIYPFNPVILIYLLGNIWTIIYLNKNKLGRPENSYNDVPELYSIDEISERFKLTRREKEIILLIYKGNSNPEISEILTISTGTVKRHIQNIYKKMDIKNRYELIYFVKTE